MTMSFDPFSELDRLATSMFRPGPKFMPVDLYREKDQCVLSADLPGIDPGSVDVDVDGHVLTIRAQRTAPTQGGSKWLAQERPHGSYLRQFSLGEGVASERISATYDNGVLSVIIPVSERAKPRKIEVSTASASEQTAINA